MPLDLFVHVTENNYDENLYLSNNPDVRDAVSSGVFRSGRDHFNKFGRRENRMIANSHFDLDRIRASKMSRLRPLLRNDMPHNWTNNKVNYLTPDLRAQTGISDTSAISAHNYDPFGLDLIAGCVDGLVLDCGAGSRPVYYENVVNYEIVDYPSTDVLGVGEVLPFIDNSFDGVISVAVLEHVRDPFTCAKEIARVLKPGGRLYFSIPFLQPYHGYPHHYFNATPQGARRLFEDFLEIKSIEVIDSGHPIWALQWILKAWVNELPSKVRKDFSKMTVEQLLIAPELQIRMPFCQNLSPEKRLELACATVLTAFKSA